MIHLPVLHLASIAHGLAASLVCFCLLYVVGMGMVPNRWRSSLGRGGHAVVIGAALYVLMCWHGLQYGFRLRSIEAAFALIAIVLGVLRAGRLASALREIAGRRAAAAGWLGLFAGLYLLRYLLTLPSVTGQHLPVAWLGNIDLFIYLDYTNSLLRPGPTQPTELYLSARDYVYFMTPAVYHLLGGYSVFWGGDPMRAAMPAQFALTALVGVLTGRIARRVFGLSAMATVVVAAATVCGPFFRYIAANYFLSTLMAMPVLLHFLLATATDRTACRRLDPSLVWSCVAHEVLLFFLYPFIFPVALMLQAAVVTLAAVTVLQDRLEGRDGRAVAGVLAEAGRRTAALLAGVVAATAVAPFQAVWVLRMFRDLSRPGVLGWPLDVVDPLALLGVPGTMHWAPANTPLLRLSALVALALVALVLAASAFWWLRRRATPEQRIFAGLSALGFAGYAAYFAIVGVSYQQWKYASYAVLPLSFVALSGSLRLVEGGIARVLSGRPAAAGRLTAVVALTVGAVLVGGNVLVHAFRDPPLWQPGGELRNIGRIDALPAFRDVTIAAPDRLTGLIAAYYLPRKRLHIRGPQRYPPVSFTDVSAARPLLVLDDSCEAAGHGDTLTIDGVGCLLFAPPSLSLDTAYPFSRRFLFLAAQGLGAREGWGRWNDGASARLTLTADPRRLRLDRDAAYLNLLLQPCLVPGLQAQRMRIGWGAGRQAEARLAGQVWVSLPLQAGDWSGEWLATQTVSFEFPDSVGPHWVDGRYLETRPLAVGFLALSVSTNPRGEIAAPAR